MTHVAFDLGLKTTGVAWDGGSDHFTCPAYLRKSPITPAQEHARYGWWRDTFRMILLPHAGADVVVEAPILHKAHPSGSIGTIMLHGILRAVALDGGHQVHTVTPSEIKAWARHGHAQKFEMVDVAHLHGWVGESHDEADAYLLWTMHAERVAA